LPDLPADFLRPPAEFSLMPFWFWNDELDEKELLRQIGDFVAHGVEGFVIHPRVGLPRSVGWMSDRLLGFMQVAIDEAARRAMKVILYDEGMYPSGSSCGQVVQHDPNLAARCLAVVEVTDDAVPAIPEGANFVADLKRASGQRVVVVDRKVSAVIRGLHYLDESQPFTPGKDPPEDTPPAGDILNPATAAMVIKLVYAKFHEHFGRHFGSTILGVFTDEPNPLGKCREKRVMPGTAGILRHVSELLGYDFTPHLPALWFDDEPDAEKHRADYRYAIRRRLDVTWYKPLSDWCAAHNVMLCGHPDRGDEIGVQRYFHAPGQDLVWRWVEPGKKTGTEGHESTQGKCSSSAMVHLSRRRNSNEFCGAYGVETTFDEFKALADWCLVRGVNLLIPHAFYYSVRGPRRYERPPQVGGVGCTWWDRFKPFADHCRRLCWLNTDSRHVCEIAVLAPPDHCPWPAAKVLLEHQRDFNYLDHETLLERARVEEGAVTIAGLRYGAVIIDGEQPPADVMKLLAPLQASGHLLRHADGVDLIRRVDALVKPDVVTPKRVTALRYRHVAKAGEHWYLFFNESAEPLATELSVAAAGEAAWVDIVAGSAVRTERRLMLDLKPFGTALLRVTS
jgi:hypothetical protein